MITITTRTDLRTWLRNGQWDLEEAGLTEAVVDALQAADHPPWGDDWESWLGEHLQAIIDAVVLE